MTKTELDADVASTNGESDALALDSKPTVIARDDTLAGNLNMSGNGQVLGSFSGDIECQGELLIGPDAHVLADIRGSRVTVAGYVRGNVVAVSRLKIMSSGRLEGDATVGALVVQEGGVHHGTIRVHPEGIPEAEAPTEDTSPRIPLTPAKPMPNPMAKVRKFWGEFF